MLSRRLLHTQRHYNTLIERCTSNSVVHLDTLQSLNLIETLIANPLCPSASFGLLGLGIALRLSFHLF